MVSLLPTKFHEILFSSFRGVVLTRCFRSIFREVQRGITPTKFRWSKFPGNMHNYIWCPYYLPSFMKFCSVVSEELHWQAASVVNFGKFLSSKGHNSNKIQEIKISWQYAQLHMVSLLPTKFHEILFSSFRGVALTNRVTDRWTDRTKTICLPTKVGGDIMLIITCMKNKVFLNLIPQASIRNKNMIWAFEFIDMGILLIISVLQ